MRHHGTKLTTEGVTVLYTFSNLEDGGEDVKELTCKPTEVMLELLKSTDMTSVKLHGGLDMVDVASQVGVATTHVPDDGALASLCAVLNDHQQKTLDGYANGHPYDPHAQEV